LLHRFLKGDAINIDHQLSNTQQPSDLLRRIFLSRKYRLHAFVGLLSGRLSR